MSAKDEKTNNKNRVSVITFILFLALIVSALSLVVIIARNNLTIDNIIGYYVDVADVKTINFKDTNLYNGVKENLLAQGIEYTEDGNILSIQIAEEDISKVTSLNLASMNIFNISGIDNFTNLTALNLEGNKITDISPLNNLNIVTLNLKNNKLTSTITNTNTLPLIFKQSQNPNSSIYTPNKLVLSNCTVSQDNSLVTVNDNITSNDNITVTIKGGAADGTTLILTHIPDTLSKETSVIPKTNTTEETNKKEETNKTIKFEDENMYNSVKENLITQGIEYREDITNKTLTIKDDNIAKVTTLNLANKNISNISGIENFTSLINLDLSGNKISDTSLLNNLKIVNLSLKNNSITDTISLGNTSYYLPLIFTESKNTNSNLYTANELDVYNCTISEDKKSIILNEGLTSKDTIIVILDGGIADGTTLTITIKDTNTKISNDTDENTNIANALNESSILPISTADAITSEDDSSTPVTIEFKDKNMYNAVKSYIGTSKISSSDDNNLTIVMTKGDIEKVTNLSLYGKNISDISGIDNFTSLTTLYLNNNKIEDIEALKSCTKLTELRLNNNQISDISALKNCTKLTYLSLYSNQIEDISALESCTELTKLGLNNNKIVNIEVLKSCTKLTELRLNNNQIEDISALESCTGMTTLYLFSNKITDTNALGSCTKLTYLVLYGNQITDISALEKCTKLTYLSLYNNQVADISALGSCTELTTLYLYKNQITDISALESCTALTTLELYSNKITDISALRNCTALKTVDLNSNKIEDISALKSCTALTTLYLNNNQIEDISALENCTELTTLYLYKNKIEDISALGKCTKLTNLVLYGNKITDISALKNCTVLTSLSLNDNQIKDISALGSCTALTLLSLYTNQISDINALKNCTLLKTLYLYSNQIEDISALENCTELTTLYLYKNKIEDISALGKCTKLTNLVLYGNKITDISALKNCTVLTSLSLNDNQIKDISALGSCTALTLLSLYTNQISDINALKNCTLLKTLYLYSNQIEDISALKNCTKLTYLYLNNNQITDISALESCTALTELKLGSNQIADISALKNCTTLKTLYLNDNQIVDISALKSCTKLTSLYLYNNQIKDITALESCTALTSLYLYSNQIEDISALGSCTSLKYLRLEENQIADISALESCTALTSLNLSKNQITDTITSKTYQLPTIFTEALNPDSKIFKLYDERNKLVTENCTLSTDNKSVTIKDNLNIGDSVTVSLSGSGCAYSTKLTLVLTEEYLKETTPTITYNNTNWTNQDVTATINFDKENISVKDANGDYTKNTENYTHLFKSNGSYTFEYKDEANEITGSAIASVENIDKVNPTANITNSNITTRSFDLNIQALDNESGVKKIDIYVDDTLEGTVSYNNDDTNNKEFTHKIDNLLPNTIHTAYIEVEDKAGNKISTKNNEISVTTESLPNIEECIDINYTPNTWTNDNVKVTISQKKIIPEYLSIEYIVEGDNTSSESYKLYDSIFTVDKNCKIKARLTDGANTSDEKSIEITNIDKIKPNISATNSNITTKSFDLNIQALDNESGIASIKVYVNGDEVKSYDYTEDKEVKDKNLTYTVDNLEQSKGYTYYIEVEDKVGNVTKGNEEEITTNTIPSGEDSLNVIYTPTDWTNNTVEISIEKFANIQSDFTIEYLVEKKDKVEDIYIPYTDKFTVDENCKIKTRLTDGKNIGIEKVVDITNIDKTLPKVAITNLSEIKQNSFSLNLIGKDEESGIKEIRVFVNGKKEKVYTYDKQSENLTEEKHQEFKLENLTQNTNYTYYIEVEDQAGNITSTETLGENVTTNSIQSLDAEITYEPQNWTNKNVEVAITPKMDINEDLSLQYKVETQDGKEIIGYTTYKNSFEVNTNCVVKAKLTDGINSSNEVTKIITNIDKEIPSMSNVDVTDITTKSFKLNIHAKDEESGIAKIYVYLDDKIIYTYDYTSEETLKEKDIVYNVDNLNDNTNYRYYIVIEDKAGNTRTSKDTYINNEKVIEEVAPQVRTNAIPDIYENVDINISPNSWTNENVLVTIKTTNELPEGVTLQYKVEAQDGKEIIGYTTYENSFEVNTNCVVKAKLTDGINSSNEVTKIITNIDKTNPETLETVISSITQNKFSIDIKGKDEESGIKEIRVYVNDKLEETYSYEKNDDINLTEDIQETFTMSDLIQDTNYKYYVEVEDQAGNITSTQELNDSVTTSIIQQLDVEVLHTPENWTNKNVLVTILPSVKLNEGIYLEYEVLTKDSKVVSKYKKYEEPFEVEDNYIIKTRLTDGINTSNEKLDIVENIDKEIPNVVNAQVLDITENSFKLHIMAQDENSGISKIRVYLNDKVVKVYEYTENLTKEKQEQLVIDSLEENTTYSYYIEVEDSAGNIKNSKSIYNIETGDIQEIEAPTITTKEKEIKNVNTSDSIYFIIPVLIISLLISIYINLSLNNKNKTSN